MFKKCKITSVVKNVKKSELLYIEDGNKKRCNCCGKQLGSFSKGYAENHHIDQQLYPKELKTGIQIKTYSFMLTAALFTVAKK